MALVVASLAAVEIAADLALFALVVASEAAVLIAEFFASLAFLVASLAAADIAELFASLAFFVASLAAVEMAEFFAESIAVVLDFTDALGVLGDFGFCGSQSGCDTGEIICECGDLVGGAGQSFCGLCDFRIHADDFLRDRIHHRV